MKKGRVILANLLIALLFSACSNTMDTNLTQNEEKQTTQEVNPNIEHEQIEQADRIQKKLLEKVSVDAEVIIPPNFSGEAVIYTASVEGFDEEKVMSALELNKQDFTVLAKELYKYKAEETILQFANEAVAGSLSFHTEAGGRSYIYDSRYVNPEEYAHIPNLGEGKEFDDFGSETAKNRILECLKGMGIDAVKVNVVSALPASFQQYEEDKRVKAEQLEAADKLEEKWEDSYFIELTTTISGIPVYESTYVSQDDSAYNGGRITAIISAKGIQYLTVPNQYRIDETTANNQRILSAEQILEKLKFKLENIIMTEELEVQKLELYYFPSIVDTQKGEFQMTPVWKITLKDSYTEFIYLFNAVNGVEIIC